MRTIGAILVGIGAIYVYGALFDWIQRKLGLDLPEKDFERRKAGKRLLRDDLVEDVERDMSRLTKKGLPYGIAALVIGTIMMIAAP
jgi:hypothetical protein